MENTQGLTLASTTSTEQTETQQEATEDSMSAAASQEQETTKEATAPTGADDGDAAGVKTAQTESAEPFLSVKYNHESKGLTQDEAVQWAQKGMKYEGVYEKICRAAAINGKEPGEFIDALEAAADAQHRQKLVEEHGDNPELIEQLMELYNIKKEQSISAANKQRKQEALDAEKSTDQRIATEYEQMANGGMFPEIKGLDSIPDAVIKAASEGMPLAYAYLLHKQSEQNKVDNAAKTAEDAAKKTTGSMATDESANETSVDRAFMDGFWRR